MKAVLILLVCLALMNVVMFGCSKSSDKVKKEVLPGQYYSFICDNGFYKVLKVLVVEEELIHVCYYNNLFDKKPLKDVIQSLYFGEKQFQDAFLSKEGNKQCTGYKHMALTLKNWDYWEPEFLAGGEVAPDELEAYEKWKNGDRFVSDLKIIPTN